MSFRNHLPNMKNSRANTEQGCSVNPQARMPALRSAGIPAVVGAFAVREDGALSVLVAALAPLLIIEGVYFLTMLLVGRTWAARPSAEKTEAREVTAGDLQFPRKPQMGEEP